MTKHIIWSNLNLNYEKDWQEFIEENYPETKLDERLALMHELNDEYLDDERQNLNINIGDDIIVIADLGLWDGRHSAYKMIYSQNIKDCLESSQDYVEWYVDGHGNFRCDEYHHDGINHLSYRGLRKGVSERHKKRFLDSLYDGSVKPRDIKRLTYRLGDIIGDIYGWAFPKRSDNHLYQSEKNDEVEDDDDDDVDEK